MIGRATDSTGAALPGVAVTVTGNGVQRQDVSSADGRFDIPDVPTGSYDVTAELPGFERASRHISLTTPESVVEFQFVLPVTGCSIVDYIDLGLSHAVIEADAVLYVRIVNVDRKPIAEGCSITSTLYTAIVLESIKADSQRSESLTVQWRQRQPLSDPLGQEYLVFLGSDPSDRTYESWLDGSYLFAVRDGKVQWPRDDLPGISDGDPLERVTSAIRVLLPAH